MELATPGGVSASCSSRPADESSARDALVKEFKELGVSMRLECQEAMKQVGLSIMEDIRIELQKLMDSSGVSLSKTAIPPSTSESSPRGTDTRPRFSTFSKFSHHYSLQDDAAGKGTPAVHVNGNEQRIMNTFKDEDPNRMSKMSDPVGGTLTKVGSDQDDVCRRRTTARDTKFGLANNLFSKASKKKRKQAQHFQPDSVISRIGSSGLPAPEERYLCNVNLTEVITSTRFDNAVGFIILLNAVVIGLQTEFQAINQTEDVPMPYYVMEQFFCAWFTGELSLRLYIYRKKFFYIFQAGWLWNYFDFFVVMAQWSELALDLIARNIRFDAKNFRVLRVLRILRLVRILRVVRVLHLISELRTIVSSISGSLKSLGWTIILLLLLMYIVAVFFTQSVSAHINIRTNGDPLTGREPRPLSVGEVLLQEHFGSLGDAVLTLWQAMSGGIDWENLATPLKNEIGMLVGFAFVAYIAFGLLALMNVVTGVFVQAALNSAKKEEDAFMTDQIVTLFGMASRTGAMITMEEIIQSLEDPKTWKEWQAIGVSGNEAQALFAMLDLNNEGKVAFDEFLGGCLRINGSAKSMDLLTMMQEARCNNIVIQDILQKIGEKLVTMDRLQQELRSELLERWDLAHSKLAPSNGGN
eukprot:TRINITY_DN29801_c0_g1_i4.p1 TRINITY_DN29801_c0_g1~~TRINITY_DN29801_c0_g1_i4.p1  ORF type:complete len:640 (-),score=150.04 TRINITY_DN29801_c0_g1_i4:733-2652(-)